MAAHLIWPPHPSPQPKHAPHVFKMGLMLNRGVVSISLIKLCVYSGDGANLSVLLIGIHEKKWVWMSLRQVRRWRSPWWGQLQWIHPAYGERPKVDAVRSVPFRMDYTNGSSCLIFRSAPVTQRVDGHVSLNPLLMKTPPLWPWSRIHLNWWWTSIHAICQIKSIT